MFQQRRGEGTSLYRGKGHTEAASIIFSFKLLKKTFQALCPLIEILCLLTTAKQRTGVAGSITPPYTPTPNIYVFELPASDISTLSPRVMVMDRPLYSSTELQLVTASMSERGQ